MKTIVTLLISLAVLTACNVKKENQALKAENDSLKEVNISLKSGNTELAVTVDSYKELLDQIDKSLASIDEVSGLVRKMGSESESKDEDTRESIKDHINNIGVLLENSRLKIIALDKNLNMLRKNAGDQSEEILELDQRVKDLASEILKKESEMITLEEELRGEITNLEIMITDERAKSAELKVMLNRAFYIKGTAKDLKEMGIVKKEGGFIGLGRVKVLNAKASNTLFTQLGKDQTRNLDFSSKKAQLISTHPDESYTFKGDDMVEGLVIIDQNAFWKNTNYLVIEVVE